MKNNAAAVNPTMNMNTAAKAMNMQSDIKASSLEEVVYMDFTKSHKKWSKYPTAPHTTTIAEGAIVSVMERKSLYQCTRVELNEFQCQYAGSDSLAEEMPYDDDDESDTDFGDVPIPLF